MVSYGIIQIVQLPVSLAGLNGHLKNELLNACAIHSSVHTDYIFATLLHKQAINLAKSYEQQANEALVKLQGVTADVKACMDIAHVTVEYDKQKLSGQGNNHEKSQQCGKTSRLRSSKV